jgi:hypothetical protein
MYKNALNNIQLALDNGYPQDKIENLLKRKQKCEQLLDENKDKYMREMIAPELFKLSYKPNPKLPFLADCLKLKVDELGYHVKTTRNLKFGDVVAIDKPFCKALNAENFHASCCNCLNDNYFDLMPCDSCTMAMFCSEKCRIEAIRKFHKYECQIGFKLFLLNPIIVIQLPMRTFFEALDAHDGNMQNLMNKIETNTSVKTVFDLDLSDNNEKEKRKKMVLAVDSLATSKKILEDKQHKIQDNHDLATKIMALYNLTQFKDDFSTEKEQNFIHEYIAKLLKKCAWEPCSIRARISPIIIGDCFIPFANLINHSCAPNVFITYFSGKTYVSVFRPIKAGEELNISLIMNHFRNDLPTRQQFLKSTFDIDCKCEACVNDYKLQHDLKPNHLLKAIALQEHSSEIDAGIFDATLHSYKHFCKYFDDIGKKYPCYEHFSFLLIFPFAIEYFESDRYSVRVIQAFNKSN